MKPELLKDSLVKIFERDLKKLKDEISLYENEDYLWTVTGRIKNSSGNLCLHLCGNLRHYIGAILGNSNYKRDREAEFSLINIPREKLYDEIEEIIAVVKKTIANLPDESFDEIYPVDVFKFKMNTGYFLIHLSSHLSYHLGQINYHRRMVAKS